jgi:hypothetical protein
MRVGFTGTRDGMTADQLAAMATWLSCRPDVTEFHHGDCVRADDQAANLVYTQGWQWFDALIVAHPPTVESRRAFNIHASRTLPPLPYLERNRHIVDACDLLLACPKFDREQDRGGTWYTIRFTREVGKPVVIFWPDGRVGS